jgi:hypothetical protein
MKGVASLLNLGDWIPHKDLRKLIWWNYLDHVDREMVWMAHGSKISGMYYAALLFECSKRGYFDQFRWMIENKNKVIATDRFLNLSNLIGLNPYLDDDLAYIRHGHELYIDYAIRTRQPKILAWNMEHGCQCTWKRFCLCGWDRLCINLNRYTDEERDWIKFHVYQIETKTLINNLFPPP